MNDFSYQQSAFDKQSSKYEELYGDQSEFEREIVEKRKKLINESSNSNSILDLGCGTGTFLKFISKKGKKIFAIDASNQMVKKATARVKKEKLSNVKIQYANAIDLPFKENFFDTVYCINTFYHIKEKDLVISEISRVLKKGGKAYLEFYNIVNPFVFVRFLVNPFAKNMPHVYPDFIHSLKGKLNKKNLQVKKLEVFSYVETSEAVKQWLPNFLFNLLVKYKNFSEKHAFFRLPKTRCVFEVKKI